MTNTVDSAVLTNLVAQKRLDDLVAAAVLQASNTANQFHWHHIMVLHAHFCGCQHAPVIGSQVA